MNGRFITAAAAGCALLLMTGCGTQPSGVQSGPSAPTGIASGITLYFLDHHDDLVTQRREVGRLGTPSEAVSLLLTGPRDSDVATGIAPVSATRTEVTVSGDLMSVRVPLSSEQVTPLGVDQIVCTATASRIQAGGPADTRIRIVFTDAGKASEHLRTCPVLD